MEYGNIMNSIINGQRKQAIAQIKTLSRLQRYHLINDIRFKSNDIDFIMEAVYLVTIGIYEG